LRRGLHSSAASRLLGGGATPGVDGDYARAGEPRTPVDDGVHPTSTTVPICDGTEHLRVGLGPGAIVKVGRRNFLKIYVKPSWWDSASQCHMATKREIFNEEYRVVAVESQSLTIQGVRSGNVLTIVNQTPVALTPADYPPGKLIALSDASNRPAN